MKRWSHGHSLGAGALFGALAASHSWTLLLGAFVLGLLLGRFWNLLHWSGEAIKAKVLHAKRDRELHLKTKPRPVYFGRDEIPY
jgi:hypothetical protein